MVSLDPTIPSHEWSLTPEGREDAARLARSLAALSPPVSVVASNERKGNYSDDLPQDAAIGRCWLSLVLLDRGVYQFKSANSANHFQGVGMAALVPMGMFSGNIGNGVYMDVVVVVLHYNLVYTGSPPKLFDAVLGRVSHRPLAPSVRALPVSLDASSGLAGRPRFRFLRSEHGRPLHASIQAS